MRVLLLGILSGMALLGCVRQTDNETVSPAVLPDAASVAIPAQDTFYNEDLFMQSIVSAEHVEPIHAVRVIVVPHHLLASDIIASLIAATAADTVERVIMIGPNHNDVSASTLSSARVAWNTPLGDVETDWDTVSALLDFLDIPAQPDAFLEEHSVGVLMPFLRHYMPDARVVPILFNSTATQDDAARVAAWLADNLGARDFVIVSTDFSHYLTQSQADEHDEITEELILNGRVERIMGLDNSYLDSPASLAVGMLYADAKKCAPHIVQRGNTNEFTSRSYEETTSYFGIAFVCPTE